MNEVSRVQQETEICAVVGRMILMASLLDNQMAEILIDVLTLDRTPNLLPVVATLDPARKVEILKGNLRHMPEGIWRKELKSYVAGVEAANRARNICGHSMLIERDGKILLASNSAAKLFKGLNRETKTIERVEIDTIRLDIRKAEETFQHGMTVRENFERFAEEFRSRRRLKRANKE
ncbi:hypothetical protein K7A42_21410 [Agrobacterium sp. InxBP2]|uniref:hypothetical protein n=1 Tax=Agrobacterium sp. InxBP2 TaxID=2870329 RepID=UPI00249F4504|nr:hypothetical protein [Agrobacterium sp. InxBP2]MCW8283460.1 hypothetical protein [Agrobacterium sp. InxBP2]